MFTWDQFQKSPVQKSNWIGLLFTQDRFGTQSGMDPKLDLLFCRSNSRSVWIRSGLVPEQSHVNRSRSGPVQCGMVPVQSHVNIAPKKHMGMPKQGTREHKGNFGENKGTWSPPPPPPPSGGASVKVLTTGNCILTLTL